VPGDILIAEMIEGSSEAIENGVVEKYGRNGEEA
jgi:hypothetical protein